MLNNTRTQQYNNEMQAVSGQQLSNKFPPRQILGKQSVKLRSKSDNRSVFSVVRGMPSAGQKLKTGLQQIDFEGF
jgi:hypothetical protein